MPGKAIVRLLLPSALIAVALVIGLYLVATPPGGERGVGDYLVFFREVTELVRAKYVEPVDEKQLTTSAINGMLSTLDPHNAYLPPDSFEEMQVQMSGAFGGLGIEITIRDGRLTVISPIEDTPAYRAGIRPGDQIVMIGRQLTRNMTINESVKRMRGPKGTWVTLTIHREGSAKPLVLKIKRDIIHIRSIKHRTLAKGYGYVRITQFQEKTGEDMIKALDALRKENGGTLKGLVLDLRNNPGGLVDSAIEVAGRFVGGGLKDGLIVTMRGRTPSSRKELYATVGKKEPRYPMVVIINGGSASASEIVAGALQDYGRAVILGTRSFGKGSVQSVIPIRNGAGLKLTTARYYTPKGRSIQVTGIIPDVIIDEELEGKPVKEGREFHEADLDNHILPQDIGPPAATEPAATPAAPRDREAEKDYQLSRALYLLKGIDLMEKGR